MAHKETGAAFHRGDRPLSPHLQIYRPQITSVTSILHRLTGVAMALGAALLVAWMIALASGAEAFAAAEALRTSLIGALMQIGFALALSYHFLNGVRHLLWDAGYGLDVDTAGKTGWGSLIGAAVLTALLVLAA